MALAFEQYLPQDNRESPEAETVVELISEALHQLLQRDTRLFWAEVLGNASLVACLESYLQHNKRAHDIAQSKDTQSIQRQRLAKNVFLVFHRMSSESTLLRNDMADSLRHISLFSAANLMDLAVLYMPSNPHLTKQLFAQALTNFPSCYKDMQVAIPKVLSSMLHVRQTCEEAAMKLLSRADISSLEGLADGLAYIGDCCRSLSAVMQGCASFALLVLDAKNQLLEELLVLHDSLLAKSIRAWAACRSVASLGEACQKVQSAAYLLGCELEILLHTLITQTCLAPETSTAPSGHSKMNGNASLGIKALTPFQKGETLLQLLQLATKPNAEKSAKTLLTLMNASLGLDTEIYRALDQGLIYLDSQQQKQVSEMLGSNLHPATLQNGRNGLNPATSSQNAGPTVNHTVIKQIQEVLPDYGAGFLAACLEAFDQNSESVIQHILEGSLPDFLQHLDQNLPLQESKQPQPRLGTAEASESIARNSQSRQGDAMPNPVVGQREAEGASNRDANSHAGPSGLRWRELEEVERNAAGLRVSEGPVLSSSRQPVASHKGTAKALQASAQEKAIAKLHAQAAQWEEYDDEYDDSFDDLAGYDADPNADPLGDEIGDVPPTGSHVKSQPSQKLHTMPKGGKPLWVKDGKIYNHRKEGATPVPNQEAAQEVIRASHDEIHGLGQGGNRALHEPSEEDPQAGNPGPSRGRGRGRGRGQGRGSSGGPSDEHRARVFKDMNKAAIGNHHRKDRALRKMGGPPA